VSLVVTRLIGGLGNQMFQYATARALTLRCGSALKLDLSGFDNVSGITPRRYDLAAFPLDAALKALRTWLSSG
jgi:hypothetical protein